MTDVSSTKGVKMVKLPVWSSQGGQDDIIWYDAAKQIDGTYKLSVDIRRHKIIEANTTFTCITFSQMVACKV